MSSERKIMSLHIEGKDIDSATAEFLHKVIDATAHFPYQVTSRVLADKSIGFYVPHWRY